jgi:uncharacterized membrane protein YbhN (UPF0104 family)
VLTLLFFAAVAVLLVTLGRRIEWGEVLDVIAGYPLRAIAGAAGLAVASYLIYSSYDLLGRAWTSHGLPAWKVMAVTFVSYAFNLNFGTMIGGIAFRFRLYSRLGLDNAAITRVLGLSLATNWLGYLVVAGAVFAVGIIVPPAGWEIGAVALRSIGVAMLLAAAGYLAVCGLSRRREWTVRGHEIVLPPLRLACMQIVLSCANWSVIAAVIFVLMQGKVGYPMVLAVLLTGALAGAIAHIPAGLGVLEAVFVALLVPPRSHGEVIAALLAYRALYYVGPLLVACGVYLFLEAMARKRGTARA